MTKRPVAWVYEMGIASQIGNPCCGDYYDTVEWGKPELSFEKPKPWAHQRIRNLRPLYTKPLSLERNSG